MPPPCQSNAHPQQCAATDPHPPPDHHTVATLHGLLAERDTLQVVKSRDSRQHNTTGGMPSRESRPDITAPRATVAKRAARANSKGSDSTSAVLALRKGPIYDPKHTTTATREQGGPRDGRVPHQA